MLATRLLSYRVPQLLTQTITITRGLAKTSSYPKPAARHWRLWAIPGEFVYRKDILARQWTMRWHPGLNVGINNERAIYALCDGIMVLSEEEFDPDYSHPIVEDAYTSRERKIAPKYARYIHVIPKKPVSEFKLVDLV